MSNDDAISATTYPVRQKTARSGWWLAVRRSRPTSRRTRPKSNVEHALARQIRTRSTQRQAISGSPSAYRYAARSPSSRRDVRIRERTRDVCPCRSRRLWRPTKPTTPRFVRANRSREPRGANVDPNQRLPRLVTAGVASAMDPRWGSGAAVGRRRHHRIS